MCLYFPVIDSFRSFHLFYSFHELIFSSFILLFHLIIYSSIHFIHSYSFIYTFHLLIHSSINSICFNLFIHLFIPFIYSQLQASLLLLNRTLETFMQLSSLQWTSPVSLLIHLGPAMLVEYNSWNLPNQIFRWNLQRTCILSTEQRHKVF